MIIHRLKYPAMPGDFIDLETGRVFRKSGIWFTDHNGEKVSAIRDYELSNLESVTPGTTLKAEGGKLHFRKNLWPKERS
jgi:hypothetical protein